jgi:hypothetical protein
MVQRLKDGSTVIKLELSNQSLTDISPLTLQTEEDQADCKSGVPAVDGGKSSSMLKETS